MIYIHSMWRNNTASINFNDLSRTSVLNVAWPWLFGLLGKYASTRRWFEQCVRGEGKGRKPDYPKKTARWFVLLTGKENNSPFQLVWMEKLLKHPRALNKSFRPCYIHKYNTKKRDTFLALVCYFCSPIKRNSFHQTINQASALYAPLGAIRNKKKNQAYSAAKILFSEH